MHDGMQYDLIYGQGHKPFKVGNLAVFKSYLLRHLQWELATDHGFLNQGTMYKFDICPSFVSYDFELAQYVRPCVCTGLFFVYYVVYFVTDACLLYCVVLQY